MSNTRALLYEMDVTPEVRSVENVCRLCLSTEEPRSSVFADRASAVSLVTKIQACLSIEIQASDKLSTSICADCLTSVNKWHSYKESCLRSQEKLQLCVGQRIESVPHIPNIKTEPMDFEEQPGSLETVPLTSDDEWESLVDDHNASAEITFTTRAEKDIPPKESLTIKRERLEDDENRNNTQIESVSGTELLLNPMAVVTSKEDRLMEADSTQKLYDPKSLRGKKKKGRRGPITHYRGIRRYKQRCNFCQIYLHSKHSYKCHMDKFHSGKKPEVKLNVLKKFNNVLPELKKFPKVMEVDEEEEDVEEMIEDVEDELISLEKDAPLTPVQQNIISQLKTFSCYSCQQSFHDRRSTLNHIRQHMPDLRPYTCIACLTEFADRSIYKLHCGASFQCAMKIALVVPEHGTEKYFTCNMCLRPLTNRKELLSHLSRHSDKQYEQLVGGPFRSPPKLKPIAPIASTPVKKNRLEASADQLPVPNVCEYCGMVYLRKPNLDKHVELCKKLPADDRVCYGCAHCTKTFLAFRKFQWHLKGDHKRRNFVCCHCSVAFKEPKDYLEHYRQHPPKIPRNSGNSRDKDRLIDRKFKMSEIPAVKAKAEFSKSLNPWSCALCPDSIFSTRAELAEHRKVHLKLKIYSCSVCRRMFGRASALQSHMLEHEQLNAANTSHPALTSYGKSANDAANASKLSINSDPGANNFECQTCGKVFANYPNLRRHVRTVHEAPGRYSCFSCAKNFKNEKEWAEHVQTAHNQKEASIGCPQCPETFDTNERLMAHRREIHGSGGDDPLACYICGKVFKTVTSLGIHRGHHFRVNSRLSIGNVKQGRVRAPIEDDDDPISIIPTASAPSPKQLPAKTPRARKSFPNATPARQLQSILQCQVCDDRFSDVADLRKHLWDVHCARNKPEKVIFPTDKLQCELCTNVLPDEESLRSHMKWHQSNPILSHNVSTKSEAEIPAECDVCGKIYSSATNLKRHKKIHKMQSPQFLLNKKGQPWGGNGFTCDVCQKVFATNSTLQKHREVSHPQGQRSPVAVSPAKKLRENQVINPVRPELDFDTIVNRATNSFNDETKKPITCNLCRKILPHKQALWTHRSRHHRVTKTEPETYDAAENNTQVACTTCDKIFSNLANMRQHYTKVHKNPPPPKYRCSKEGCDLAFRSYEAMQSHEKAHVNVMYACPVCPKRMPSRAAMNEHMSREHKIGVPNFIKKNEKSTNPKKPTFGSHAVKGANTRQCPLCKITYPNNRAMKIHYRKVHHGAP